MRGQAEAGARIEVRRSGERFVTVTEGRTTWHSFSFDRHYDPENLALGFLVCHNDDLVAPGHGYPLHRHRDLEIVTWVLEGALRHEDSTGHGGVVAPGSVQRLSAGAGVQHSEVTEGPDPVRFVQMWVRPDEPGLPPKHQQLDVGAALDGGGWVTLASGHSADAAVELRAAGATLRVVRLAPGGSTQLPEAALMHLFVARGEAVVESVAAVGTGDAVRLFGTGGQTLGAPGGAELLLWEMTG